MLCPKCGESLPEQAGFCAACGYKIKKSRKANKKLRKILLWSALGMFAAAILGGALYWFFGMKTVYLPVKQRTAHFFAQGEIYETTYEYEYTATGKLKTLTLFQNYGADITRYKMEYEWKGNKIVSGKLKIPDETVEFTYNYDGGKLESVDSDTIEGAKIRFQCNSDGLIDEVLTYQNGEVWNAIKLTYYKNGRIKTFEENFDNRRSTYVRYDKEGRTVERKEKEEWESGSSQSWQKYKYDQEGHQISVRSYDEDGNLYYSADTGYTYDKQGNVTDVYVLTTDQDGTKTRTDYILEQDGADIWVKVESVDGDTTVPAVGEYVACYRTDQNGNLLELEYYEDGEVYFQKTCEYKKIRVPKSYIEPAKDSKYLIPLVRY